MRKINIHFTVDDKTIRYCRNVNARIRDITSSTIVFNENSSMIPHITIVMGEFDENKFSLDQIWKVVSNNIKNARPIKFYIPKPYLENSVNRYVFSDVDGGRSFLDLREQIKNIMQNGYLENMGGSYGEQPPHLTLAHIENEQDKVRSYLTTTKAGFTFTSKRVEISDVGPKGTCINSLKIYDLRKKGCLGWLLGL